MAPYHLILLLLTGLTPLHWLNNLSPYSIRPVQLSQSEAISRFTLAQETTLTPDETPSSDSDPDFPIGLILLGVGGLTITGGAVFILMRLLNRSSEDPEEPDTPSLTKTDSPATTLQKPLIDTGSPLSKPEASPQEPSSASLTEFPMTPDADQKTYSNTTTEPIDKPKFPQNATSDVPWMEDKPHYGKIDPIEQWIIELRDSNPTHRSQAIWELGQHGDSRAIQPLVELLLSSDSKQRSLILASLSEISTRTLKPMNRALSLSLQDENAEVRKNAIRDLSRIYDLITQMSQLLQRAMDDPDAEVQETAQWAINKLARIRPSLPSQDDLVNKEMRRRRKQGKRGEES